MPSLVQSYETETGLSAPQITYGASGKLVGQVLAGAPLSGVVLASERQLKRLGERDLILGGTIVNLATNHLVLARRGAEMQRTLTAVAEDAESSPLAIGDPRFVPVGRYAQDVLVAEGLWDACEPHLIRGGHVAAVLAYLQSGAVDAAIVYGTDLHGQSGLSGAPLSQGDRPSPQVVGAEIGALRSDERVNRFLSFLASPEGQRIFQAHGFGPPG